MAGVMEINRSKAVQAESQLCDLCDRPTVIRYDASDFKIAGRVCGQCREELRQERAVFRQKKLSELAYFNPGRGHETRPRVVHLPIVNPYFHREELTPKAACSLLLAETRRIFAPRGGDL